MIATIDPAALRMRLDQLEDAGEGLRRVPLDERVAIIDRVAATWRDPASPWRRRALATIPATTGYAAGAVAYALDALWGALGAPDVAAVATRDLGPGTGTPERLAFHSLAGNVPGAGVFGVIAALLAGVPSIVKTARREPDLLPLVAASIADADRRLGDALAVVHWPGGSEAHEALAVERSSVVLAYGRAATLDRVEARQPRRLLRFGPRASIAVVGRDAVDATTATVVAHQTALFEQQGCLSPQYLVVEEGGPTTTAAFIAAVATALQRFAAELPPPPLTLHEAARVSRFIERARWLAQEGAAIDVVAERGFGIVCDRTETLPASPLHRHLVVLPVATLADGALRLAALTGGIEAVGVAAPPSRRAEAATLADAVGAHRLCPLDRMQAPPFAWRQSGHMRLASFLEPSARIAVSIDTATRHDDPPREACRESSSAPTVARPIAGARAAARSA